MKSLQLMPDLFCFRDTCNVYVVRNGGETMAIDFGSGRWLRELPRMGIAPPKHVFLTHHHTDQCAGLESRRRWPFTVHAPSGEERFLEPRQVAKFHATRGGCPASYSVLERGVANVQYDMRGFSDLFVGTRRVRFMATPGHGANALSIIIDHRGRQVVFCGDAAHAGATIHEPYHLEWDHWTGSGALAAWEGIERLGNIAIDLLCPSHGPVTAKSPRRMLRKLSRRLMQFYKAKGSICPGERDRYVASVKLACGARRVLPHLYQFGENGYLLASNHGEALVVDTTQRDLAALDALLKELGLRRVTAAVLTHYHSDHSDAANDVRKKHGAKVWMHPWVAQPLKKIDHAKYPWLPGQPVRPDRLWPENGTWRWNEYEFRIAPFPGQTRWHSAFQARIDGVRVFFGGDNFQPASRWNGTGGFCAFNGSRFEGFRRSAALLLKWKPQLLACGHQTYYRFSARHCRKIIAWSKRAGAATRELCPTGNLERDYFLHQH